MKSISYLDAVRHRHDIPSDNQLAKFLGVGQGTIASIRTGARKLDGGTALAIAEALDEPPEYVTADIQVERATNPDLRRVWRNLARLAKKKATFK